MSLRRIAALGFLTAAGLLALSAQAPAGPVERLFTRHHGYIPACDSAWALQIIAWRFGFKEAYFWGTNESLSQFGHVREIAYRPWGGEYVPRRYCEARVLVSNHRDTKVYYSIIEKGGFAGVGWGVEWCVVGYDYNFAYAPNCRAARP